MSNTLPDTGARSQFETGAMRDACVGKGLPSRIPPEAIRRLAKRYEDGEAKYPDKDGVPNWMRGIPLSRYFDSAMRHLLAAAEGDQSEDHLGAVLWNAAGWIWTEDEISAGRLPSSLDDLPFAQHDDSRRFPRTCRIRFSDGKEFDVPPLPEGYDGFRVLPHTHGVRDDEMAYFWYPDGTSCAGWGTWSGYDPGPGQSSLYWIVAERSTLKPGDRVRVTDSDGPGEPYEFEAEVESVTPAGAIRTTGSAHRYRKDQVTVLP